MFMQILLGWLKIPKQHANFQGDSVLMYCNSNKNDTHNLVHNQLYKLL